MRGIIMSIKKLYKRWRKFRGGYWIKFKKDNIKWWKKVDVIEYFQWKEINKVFEDFPPIAIKFKEYK